MNYLFESLYRHVKEKIEILKNLANFDLPTEELNDYIKASDGLGT